MEINKFPTTVTGPAMSLPVVLKICFMFLKYNLISVCVLFVWFFIGVFCFCLSVRPDVCLFCCLFVCLFVCL